MPVVNVRNNMKCNERYIDLTPDVLKSIYEPTDPEYELLKFNRTRGDEASLNRMIRQYQTYMLQKGTIQTAHWPRSAIGRHLSSTGGSRLRSPGAAPIK